MFSKKWSTSERKYGVIAERDVSIPMSDGITVDCDVFRPNDKGRFPAILGVHCYPKTWQSIPSVARGMMTDPKNGGVEAGDPEFYVRRGYAHVIANVRGSGRSGGEYTNYGPREVQDTYEAIEWIASQPWCDGNVGMFGVSYFAIVQKQVAALNPPHLKAIFAPFGYSDFYRDKFYHGGILSHAFMKIWSNMIENCRAASWTKEKIGEKAYKQAIAAALQDKDICAVPHLVEALKNPDRAANALLVDILLNPLDGPYYQERNVKHDTIKVPSYLGGGWGMYGLHLPGDLRSWENIKAPKKMVIGPPVYLDRPLYQYQYESLRWFDHWMKGIDNDIMEGPPIRVFVMGTDGWKTADDWPLPETKWTPFYLHKDGLLSEHEFWPNEGGSSYEDNPFSPHGNLTFLSPPMVEETEVIGPIVLNLYASTTDTELLLFASLLDVDPNGQERLLTKGWLKGSQRAVDPKRSKPWEPFHPHTKTEPLTPHEIYEFNVKIVPTGNLFKAGHRIGLRISSVDVMEEVRTTMDALAMGHLSRQTPSWTTLHHNADYPSHLLLPVTRGNFIGTYLSGGQIPYGAAG